MRRSSSLHSIDTFVERNISNDKYQDVVTVADNIDAILNVNDNITTIEAIGDYVTQIVTIIDNIDAILVAAGLEAEITALGNITTEIQSLYADKTTLDSLYADKATLDSLFADKTTLDSLFSDKAILNSLYADKITLDSLFNDKTTLDSLFNDKTTLDSLYADKAKLDALYTNLTKLTTVADNIDDVVTVANNISDISNVVTDVIPNMAEILLADDNAATASTKADEASNSATEAYNWAQYTEDSLVPEGNLVDEYSAYHYAQKAGDSADAASSSAASAEAAWDSFDDRYLGSKATAPTTDNDGDPLVEGMIYWNSTDKKFQVYDGVSWNDAYFEITSGVTSFNTRTGAVTLTNTDVTNAVGVDLSGVEAGATADQSDLEIETAYNNRVDVVSQTEAESGSSSTVYRWTPERVAQAIASLAVGGGDMYKSMYDPTDVNGDAFARGNHTGTQLMATISDAGDSATLDVGTSAGTVAAGDHNHDGVYEPADSTILKDADIGVTVQGYDADTAKTDMDNSWTAHQTFQEISETVYALVDTGIDTGNGTIQTKTLGANTTFTDALTSGQSVKLTLLNSGSYTVTWPTITWISATEAAGSAPTVSSSYATHIEVWKEGSTLYGALVGYSS